jgi:acyl-CoA dehydrogenase
MFRRFQRLLPKISETERIALQSGRRSIEGDIFQGKKSQVLTTLNYPVISNDCKKAMDKYVRPLCNSLNNYSITQKGGLSEDQINKCRPLFGLGIPPESGGLGLNRHDQSQIVQTVASRSVAAGVTVMVPNSLGPAELIHHYGTDSQRATLLPDLAEGKLIPCFGLTGTYSGSDAASMRDTGRVYKTDSGLRIKLNCEKRYITLAPLADIIGIAFNLEDPDNLIPSGKSGITLALLSRDTNGLEIGSRHHPLNAYFHNGPFRGTDLDFPITQVVGDGRC